MSAAISSDTVTESDHSLSSLGDSAVELLEKLLEDSGNSPAASELDCDKPYSGWRHHNSFVKNIMIISSYGSRYPGNVPVTCKLVDGVQVEHSRLAMMARLELDLLLDLYQKDRDTHISFVCSEYPGIQLSKQYYWNRIRKFLMSSPDGAVLFYTGHSEKATGNWCFEDGIITFYDIYNLYKNFYKDKPLTIITDCNYSGAWVNKCIEMLDKAGIPSCGHHTRKHGLLLKVLASCGADQLATMYTYANEAMTIDARATVNHWTNFPLLTGQVTTSADFRMIRCPRQPTELCDINTGNKWSDRLLTNFDWSRVFMITVRIKEQSQPAWHYVLVNEEKVKEFTEQARTGIIDVANYGKVMYSGWGRQPPDDIKAKMALRYMKIIEV